MNNSAVVWRLCSVSGLLAVSCTALLAGCTYNPVDYPDTAPVTGTVTLDGQPLEGATVTFLPRAGRSSSGKTDASGRYELNYTGTIKGSMLGTMRVSITKIVLDPNYVQPAWQKKMELAPMPEAINLIPDRYSGNDSELSAEVQSTKNVTDFDLISG